jgi:hypothetical protein
MASGGAPEPEPEVTSSGPNAGRYMATTFTRKRWKDLREAWASQHAVEARAQEVKSSPKRRALQKAAKLAESALLVAEAEEGLRVSKLRSALQAAADATTLTKALDHARDVETFARAIVDDELNDEEDAFRAVSSAEADIDASLAQDIADTLSGFAMVIQALEKVAPRMHKPETPPADSIVKTLSALIKKHADEIRESIDAEREVELLRNKLGKIVGGKSRKV